MINYADIVNFWRDKKIQNAREFEIAINGKIVALAYHSGKLENAAVTYNDTREIFEHDRVSQYTGDLRTLFEIRNAKDADVLKAAAYFHVKLENIHAFADGNGRVGRLALNYFLLMRNHPPVIIHEEDRKKYFAGLEAWDDRQELALMVDFLTDQTIKTWRKDCEKK